MKVILQEEVKSLGAIGAVVNVKAGYARNYLFPQHLAVVADNVSLKQLEQYKKSLEAKRQKLLIASKEVAAKIEKTSITINKKVGEEDKIFGSVTSQELVDILKDEGFEVDKKDVSFEEEIKKIGVYHATIKLTQGVDARLKFWVVAQ